MAEDDVTTGGPTRVTRTGIALVHEGELILPAVGSEAEGETVLDDARAVIQYHFPVHIQVSSGADSTSTQEIVEEALRSLARGLRNGG